MTDIVVIFCCSLLGYVGACIINRRLRDREMVYNHLMLFATDMSNNVQHARVTIVDFLANSTRQYKDTVHKLMQDSSDVACKMSKVEKQEVADFFAGLRANNSSSLVHHLDRYTGVFESQYNKLHQSNKQQYSVNNKVGILLGAVLALLLI